MRLVIASVAALLVLPGEAAQPPPIRTVLSMRAGIIKANEELAPGIPTFHRAIELGPLRPAGIVREPAYRGTPVYGAVKLGNGPNALTLLVLDQPAPADMRRSRLFVDANRNGDLTDDGGGDWESTTEFDGEFFSGSRAVQLRASWGDDKRETASAAYQLSFMLHNAMPGDVPQYMLSSLRDSARVGVVERDGVSAKVALVEGGSAGLFVRDGEIAPGGRRVPLWLLIDMNADGVFGDRERLDAGQPFQWNDGVFQADMSPAGDVLVLRASTEVPQDTTPPSEDEAPPPPPLLAPGTAAPDFLARGVDGKDLKLSDLRGQVVILDFWATWCRPCIAQMPKLRREFAPVRPQGAVVLSVCVWDTEAEFSRWTAAHAEPDFIQVFDPAGKDREASIARRLYNVTGIPTMYVIGRDGKIVDGIVGLARGKGGDPRLAAALGKAGLQSDAQR